MRTRQEIKAIGKAAFKENYWTCVLAMLLVTVVLGVLNGLGGASSMASSEGETSISLGSGAGGILSLLLTGPLSIGLAVFFVRNALGQRENLTVTTPFTEAFVNYGRKLGGYLWMMLFTFLWSLLFVIPGIIKGLSYGMTPYILGDCPEVKAKDALKLSMRMMDGHKAELFVMELSFLGWALLGALTAGILLIFYVGPYMNSAFAVYYLEVREEALRNGVITEGQLRGVEPV